MSESGASDAKGLNMSSSTVQASVLSCNVSPVADGVAGVVAVACMNAPNGFFSAAAEVGVALDGGIALEALPGLDVEGDGIPAVHESHIGWLDGLPLVHHAWVQEWRAQNIRPSTGVLIHVCRVPPR